MASALYLENFLESIETLPQELQRNFSLMRDLDQRTQDLLGEIDTNSHEYKSSVKELGKDERKDRLSKIQELFQKAREYSDDKVQIAMQMYEMVDKHIRRLDGDLSRFEQELQMKDPGVRPGSISSLPDLPTPTQTNWEIKKFHGWFESQIYSTQKSYMSTSESRSLRPSYCATARVSEQKTQTRKRAGEPPPASAGSGRRRKHVSSSCDEAGPSAISVTTPGVTLSSAGGTDVLDMPVDPNEPTYCLCHQVSFGEMIGCDNPDCPIEWFHFQCVGLSCKPKGKWYCPICTQEREKSRKKF